MVNMCNLFSLFPPLLSSLLLFTFFQDSHCYKSTISKAHNLDFLLFDPLFALLSSSLFFSSPFLVAGHCLLEEVARSTNTLRSGFEVLASQVRTSAVQILPFWQSLQSQFLTPKFIWKVSGWGVWASRSPVLLISKSFCFDSNNFFFQIQKPLQKPVQKPVQKPLCVSSGHYKLHIPQS